MWELLRYRIFSIIGHVIFDSTISSSHSFHHPWIRSFLVQNWQFHCRDFENLDFANYMADSSVPLRDFENLDDSKYLNSAKQCFIEITAFCKTIGQTSLKSGFVKYFVFCRFHRIYVL